MTDQKETPHQLGYRMPAEWEPHEGTWIAWPKNPDSFPKELLPEVEKTYVEVIRALIPNEKVNLLVDDSGEERRIIKVLNAAGINFANLSIHKIRTADVWFRDYGPIFIARNSGKGKEVACTHWIFNAWGNKYDELKADTNIPNLMPKGDCRSFEVPMVLEGGSIDTNGKGTFLTTEQCLLNKNRNPSLSRTQIEKYLSDYLGASKIIWLKDGIEGDDTDGHVDDLARFVNDNTVLCSFEENSHDTNSTALRENFNLLKNATDQDGNKLNIVTLPMPDPVKYNGIRLPASYSNFYIANNVVLVPVFGDKNDTLALSTISRLFQGRKVIGINCRALVYGFGAIHCVTQQQPAKSDI